MLFGTVAAILAIAGGVLYVLRLRQRTGPGPVTDEMIDQIERTGSIEVDEPLDLDEIADEEARFWDEERWDEADDY